MPANVNAEAFIPQVWDAAVYRTLEDNLIAKQICNIRPTGKVKGYGDTVYFNGLADPTVNNYTGSVDYETLKSGQIALKIDQQNYYAFKVTDVEQAMSNVDLKGSQAQRAAYELKKAADTHIMGLYAEGTAGVITDATCDSATILSALSGAARKLQEANVNEGDGWVIIPPWVKEKLVLAGVKFSINEGINKKGGLSWAEYLGLNLYVTNQVVNTGTVDAPVSKCMFGSKNAVVFADLLMKSETLRLEGSFDNALRGLHVYGAKVAKPAELGYMDLTYAVETAI